MKRIIRRIFISTVVLILLLNTVGSFFITGYVNNNFEDLLGRKAKLSYVAINPFNLSLYAFGGHVYEKDNQTEFFSFMWASIGVEWSTVVSSDLNVDELSFFNPDIRIEKMGDKYNVSDIIELFSEEDPTSQTSDVSLNINEIGISSGRITYLGVDHNDSICIDDISFDADHINLNWEDVHSELAFELGEDGEVALDLDINLNTYGIVLETSSSEVDLNILQSYLSRVINVGKLEGLYAHEFKVEFQPATGYLKCKGQLGVDELLLLDQRQDTVMALNSTCVIDEIDTEQGIFVIDSLVIDQSILCYSIVDSLHDNFDLLMDAIQNRPEEESLIEEESASNYFQLLVESLEKMMNIVKESNLEINKVASRNGEIRIKDYSLATPFSLPITAVDIEMDSLSYKRDFSAMTGTAVIGTEGNAEMVFKFTNDAQRIFLELKIDSVDMMTMSTYAEEYLARPILKGRLEGSSKILIKKGRLNNTNSFKAKQFVFGKKIKGKKSIGAPIGILKSPNRTIPMDFKIKGDVNDPNYKFGKLIRKSVKNIILSPVKIFVGSGRKRAIREAEAVEDEDLSF